MSDVFWTAFWTAVPICLTVITGFTLQVLDRRRGGAAIQRQIQESVQDVKQTAKVVANEAKETTLQAVEASKASMAINTKLTAATADKVSKVVNALNGEFDEKVKAVVDKAIIPLKEAIDTHQTQDEANMVEIRSVLADLIKIIDKKR